jgi:uncharacterized protein YbjT (DUF2867 family)
MNKKILVTGATGAAGGEVVKKLASVGANVRAAARNLDTAGAALSLPGVEVVLFDYERPETIPGAFAGVDRLFLVAPPFHPETPKLLLPVIEEARKAGVIRIVMLSAMGTERDEQSPLRVVERTVERSGVPWTILRPNWFMQNFSGRLRPSIQRLSALYLPAGDGRTSFIDTRDIGAAAAAAFMRDDHRNRAYTLTGAAALDHREVCAALSGVTGKKIRYIPVSDDDTRGALKGMGWPEASVEILISLYKAVREGLAAAVSPDLPAVLGRPPVPFEKFAEDHAALWK